LAAWLAVVALTLACASTKVTYAGPRRAAHEVTTLVSAETELDMLDRQRLYHVVAHDGGRYEILPGRHMLGVSLLIVSVTPGDPGEVEKSASTAVLCLDAQAGHTYFVGHEGRGAGWRPSIIDGDSHVAVPFAPCS
jgi:hypothetical protein